MAQSSCDPRCRGMLPQSPSGRPPRRPPQGDSSFTQYGSSWDDTNRLGLASPPRVPEPFVQARRRREAQAALNASVNSAQSYEDPAPPRGTRRREDLRNQSYSSESKSFYANCLL